MLFKSPTQKPSRFEFIAMMAMMMATNAFSVDAMLPAMSEMGHEMSPDNPVRIQLIITLFMVGMGIGTLFTGPLSDAYGRRKVLLAGGVVYCIGALLAWIAPTLELMLAARMLQGLGASGSRVVSMAMVRDRFSGPVMAQVTSLIITVFMLVPALAPAIGAGIIYIGGWRSIYLAFLVFTAVVMLWFMLRQPETLHPEDRRPIDPKLMKTALVQIIAIPMVRRTVIAMGCMFAMMLTNISSTEMVFEQTLGRGDQFPFWFGLAAISSLVAPIVNSKIVIRYGMHKIASAAMGAQAILAGCYLIALQTGWVAEDTLLWYFLWQISVFMTMGLSMGNLNALMMEPLGHVAGIASSLITALSTVIGAAIAIPAAAMFNGTQVPLVLSIFCFMVVARALLFSKIYDQTPEPVPGE